MKFADLSEGASFDRLDVLVMGFNVRHTKKGDAFALLTLRDTENETLPGRMWDYDQKAHGFIKTGAIIEIRGDVGVWKDELQLNIKSLKPSTALPDMFARSSTLDIAKVSADVRDIIESFENPYVKAVAADLYKDFEEKLLRAPAAMKIHNAWYGGLIEHAWSMCRMAEPVVKHYLETYKAPISRDRVMFGCIFHDIGKTIDYDCSTPSFGMTPVGSLTPHMVTGIGIVYEAASRHADKVPEGGSFEMERAQLVHLVAAHHGQLEWGSPVTPATLEAKILHYLDHLDGDLLHAMEIIDGGEGDVEGFSDKSWVEHTRFYRGDNA